MKLIGFPNAGISWAVFARLKYSQIGWTEGTGAGAPRRTDYGILPPGIDDIGGTVNTGDITGASGRKAKRARAVGNGDDPAVQRVQALDDWRTVKKLRDQVDQLASIGITADGHGHGRTDDADVASIAASDWTALYDCQAMIKELIASRAELLAALAAERTTGDRILFLAGGNSLPCRVPVPVCVRYAFHGAIPSPPRGLRRARSTPTPPWPACSRPDGAGERRPDVSPV
jgi:hypothetical protein